MTVALAGALLTPLLLLVATGQGQSEVAVIERSGELLLRHGTPYLAEPHTVAEYTPYLPGMALFGLPRALFGADGWPARLLGDARLWCAAVFLGCLAAAVRPGRPGAAPHAGGRASVRPSGGVGGGGGLNVPVLAVAALVASPPVALPLCVSGVDLPLAGLCLLALALAGRARPFAAGSALALACALKWTAWPAVAVVVALLAATAGRRSALRAFATAAVGTAALVLPGALRAPGPLVEQVFAFPTGRGGLLADLGPGGWYTALALLLLAGLAVAASLVRTPPRDTVAAADRLALGLALAFLLAPATRFGYLALPAVLALVPRLPRLPLVTGPHRPPRPQSTPRAVPSAAPRPRTPQVVPVP
ncbi:hypothetical protein ACFVVU_20455 [Kitasatospora sp. NPDC057965]|uniref:hypothetical protein n=1 Tax=Kitasatospora sp. NPDC057965 TaxID=3346291 RepID=UPI0036D76C30